MFKVIARCGPAAAAFGVLTIGSFGVNAQSLERATAIPRVTVRYADLNLNTPVGVEALYSRLRAAAREVCGVHQRRALVEAMEAKTCYRQALGAAVEDAKLPTLSALHRAGRAHYAPS
jgi:UrcA family protein